MASRAGFPARQLVGAEVFVDFRVLGEASPEPPVVLEIPIFRAISQAPEIIGRSSFAAPVFRSVI